MPAARAYELDDEDAVDERGCLRSGHSLKVHPTFMDSAFRDDVRRRGALSHRPGFVDTSMVDAELAADAIAAFEEKGRRQREAWRDATVPPYAGHQRTQDARKAPAQAEPARRPASAPTGSPEAFDAAAAADAEAAFEERRQKVLDAWKG